MLLLFCIKLLRNNSGLVHFAALRTVTYNIVMGKIKNSYLHFSLLVLMIVFTIALAVNTYNSGVYADAHQLNGASVGWFAPNGVLIFLLSAIVTVCYGIYLFLTLENKQQ